MQDMYMNETTKEWKKRVTNNIKRTKRKNQKKNEHPRRMRNITINIPDIYDKNLLKLQKQGMIPSRSEGVRLAIREFLQNEYKILKILGWYED